VCGISGLVNFDKIQSGDVEVVKRINNVISHRGPDAWGKYENDSIVFAHRRLAIIDLSDQSNQPMLDDTGDICLVFNGEIYNHQNLRRELQADYDFKTDHSDTETVIYAYRKWGMDCLEKFFGMFAFALFDRRVGKVFLCRDRLGKKPLFYAATKSGIYFSSESAALFENHEIEKKISEAAIYDYLTFLTVEAPKTFFEGVYKVPAGYYLEISREDIKSTKYWDIADHLNVNNNDEKDTVVQKTKELLEISMRHRNIADVPVAVALSGGLDSSLNAYFTKFFSEHDVAAINIAYAEKSKFDESDIAARYSSDLDLQYHGIKINQDDYKQWILQYFEAQKDAPIGDPNSPLLFGICKIAAEKGFKVLQVGEGGDEIGGYPIYTQLAKLDKYMRFAPKWLIAFASKLPLPRKIRREFEVIKDGGTISRRFLFGFTDSEKKKFWEKPSQPSSLRKLAKYGVEIRGDLEDSFLRKVLNIEYKVRLAELILPRVDYPSMASSVEARSPFMDHDLIEYSAGLPFRLKMEHGPKSILREIAAGMLPGYLMEQPKVGFGMLLTPFLNEELPQWFRQEILEVEAPIKAYVSDSFLQSIYKKHLINREEGYRIWILYSLNTWLLKH
jgi:asparagine synthase (glutamine-hydrolysing)